MYIIPFKSEPIVATFEDPMGPSIFNVPGPINTSFHLDSDVPKVKVFETDGITFPEILIVFSLTDKVLL